MRNEDLSSCNDGAVIAAVAGFVACASDEHRKAVGRCPAGRARRRLASVCP
jgi:hypothetical protein